MSEISERYRKVAGAFTRARRRPCLTTRGTTRRRATGGWRVTSSVTWWSGCPWMVPRGRRSRSPAVPSVDDDPVGRMGRLQRRVQAALDDPDDRGTRARHAGRALQRGERGRRRSASATSWCTPGTSRERPVSTRRSTPTRCTACSKACCRWTTSLRQSGHYGPRVDVPDRRRRTDQAHRLHRPHALTRSREIHAAASSCSIEGARSGAATSVAQRAQRASSQ